MKVPEDPGVYIFYRKDSNKKAYIGRAIGKKGLKQRILKQHLSSSYSKSVFKIGVIRKYSLASKPEAAKYIMDNFTVSWLPVNESNKSTSGNHSLAKLIETLLLYEFETEFNKE